MGVALLRLPVSPPVSPAKTGVHVPSTLRLSQWLAGGPTPSPRRKPGSTSLRVGGGVDSGFRRNDGWGWPYSVSPSALPSPRRKPGSTSPPRFGYLSGSPAAQLRLPGESRGPRPWGGWGAAWFPASAGMTEGGGPTPSPRQPSRLPGFRRGPRPFHASAVSVVHRRPNSVSPAKAGVHVPGGLGGGVVSGFRRNDGRGWPYSVSPAKAGVHVPSTLRLSQRFTGGPTPSPRRKPGSTSLGGWGRRGFRLSPE